MSVNCRLFLENHTSGRKLIHSERDRRMLKWIVALANHRSLSDCKAQPASEGSSIHDFTRRELHKKQIYGRVGIPKPIVTVIIFMRNMGCIGATSVNRSRTMHASLKVIHIIKIIFIRFVPHNWTCVHFG